MTGMRRATQQDPCRSMNRLRGMSTISLSSSQRHPCEWTTYSGTVVIHVPLPGLFQRVVKERRMKAGRGIASEEYHGFVGGTAIGRSLARYLVHLNVLAAKQPLEVHIMDGLLVRDCAAQNPMPHQAWKERVGSQLLREHRCGRAQQCETEHQWFEHAI